MNQITPTKSKRRKTAQLMDIPADLHLVPGTRLQVKWTISDDGDEDGGGRDAEDEADQNHVPRPDDGGHENAGDPSAHKSSIIRLIRDHGVGRI